jgi:hypothetical protein
VLPRQCQYVPLTAKSAGFVASSATGKSARLLKIRNLVRNRIEQRVAAGFSRGIDMGNEAVQDNSECGEYQKNEDEASKTEA